MFFLYLLSALCKGSLFPQYTITRCNPAPSLPFVLRKVLTIHMIKHFQLAAGHDGGHSHCGFTRFCKAIRLVTNISIRNILLHMTYCCSMKLLLSSVSRPWTYRQRYSWRKLLTMRTSVLCCARVTHYITMPKVKQFKSCNLKHIVVEFGDDIFSSVGGILCCKMCDTQSSGRKRFMVQQHIRRGKHIQAV
jgi:hypothetical protein